MRRVLGTQKFASDKRQPCGPGGPGLCTCPPEQLLPGRPSLSRCPSRADLAQMFAACQAFPGSGEGPARKERRAINQTRGILEICITPLAAAEPAAPPASPHAGLLHPRSGAPADHPACPLCRSNGARPLGPPGSPVTRRGPDRCVGWHLPRGVIARAGGDEDAPEGRCHQARARHCGDSGSISLASIPGQALAPAHSDVCSAWPWATPATLAVPVPVPAPPPWALPPAATPAAVTRCGRSSLA